MGGGCCGFLRQFRTEWEFETAMGICEFHELPTFCISINFDHWVFLSKYAKRRPEIPPLEEEFPTCAFPSPLVHSGRGNLDRRDPKCLRIRTKYSINLRTTHSLGPSISPILHKCWWALGILAIREMLKFPGLFRIPAVGKLGRRSPICVENRVEWQFYISIMHSVEPINVIYFSKMSTGLEMLEIREIRKPQRYFEFPASGNSARNLQNSSDLA